jgi:hypothetical protein
MEANSYGRYEDAGRQYIERLNAVVQLLQDPPPIDCENGEFKNKNPYIELSGEIADISAAMIRLAEGYQNDPDPTLQEGLFAHFLDQATAELLLETGLLQLLRSEKTGAAPGAAIQATHSAALREAIHAAEKSLTTPIRQGLATGASYRITEAGNAAEAASSFQVAFGCTASGISRRVQELGSDIATDLIAGRDRDYVIHGDSFLQSDSTSLLKEMDAMDGRVASRAAYISCKLLLNAYGKVTVLSGSGIGTEMREKVGEWIKNIMQTGKIELFNDLVDKFYGLDELIRSNEKILQNCSANPEFLNRTSDLIKKSSDKFIVLTGRMRKLEDAIRLGKFIQLPQLLPAVVALQLQLLTSLVHAGYDYINRCDQSCKLWRA